MFGCWYYTNKWLVLNLISYFNTIPMQILASDYNQNLTWYGRVRFICRSTLSSINKLYSCLCLSWWIGCEKSTCLIAYSCFACRTCRSFETCSDVFYLLPYKLIFLVFDFCRFCVVNRFFHPRHNGQ